MALSRAHIAARDRGGCGQIGGHERTPGLYVDFDVNIVRKCRISIDEPSLAALSRGQAVSRLAALMRDRVIGRPSASSTVRDGCHSGLAP